MMEKTCQVPIHSFIHHWSRCHGKAEWRMSLERKRPSTGRLSADFAWILGDKSVGDPSFLSEPSFLSDRRNRTDVGNLLYHYILYIMLLHVANLCFADSMRERIPPIHVIREAIRIVRCPNQTFQANCSQKVEWAGCGFSPLRIGRKFAIRKPIFKNSSHTCQPREDKSSCAAGNWPACRPVLAARPRWCTHTGRQSEPMVLQPGPARRLIWMCELNDSAALWKHMLPACPWNPWPGARPCWVCKYLLLWAQGACAWSGSLSPAVWRDHSGNGSSLCFSSSSWLLTQ